MTGGDKVCDSVIWCVTGSDKVNYWGDKICDSDVKICDGCDKMHFLHNYISSSSFTLSNIFTMHLHD